MAITYPDHWKEPYHNKGPKYDKIKEIIDICNLPIPVRHALPFYTSVRLGDFSWVNTDRYIEESTSGGTSITKTCYFYLEVNENLTTIEVTVYGTFVGTVGNEDMDCYVYLETCTMGGAWATIASNSFAWESDQESDEVITLSSITPGTGTTKKYRLRIVKQADDAVSIDDATLVVYSINLIQ